MKRLFANVIGAIAFVAASSFLAALFYYLAVWIGWQTSPSVLGSMRSWLPIGDYEPSAVYLAHRSLTEKDLSFFHMRIMATYACITQGVALIGAALWIRCVGWPKYWREFASSRRRKLFWSACWKSSLVLAVTWFAAEATYVTFYRMHLAAQYPVDTTLDLSFYSVLLNWLAIPVIQFLVTAHFLTRAIRQSLTASERMCVQCGHHLTSTVAMTCFECGKLEPWPFVPRFGWLRVFTSRGWNKWGLFLWIVPLLMLMAPVVTIHLHDLLHVVQKLLRG